MIDTLCALDDRLMLFLNGFHIDFFDRFMMMFTGRFIWIPMYVAMFIIMARTYRGRTLIIYLIGIALTITLADQICASLIRPYVARLRPSNPENPLSQFVHIVNNYRGGRYGFPSCHAANSFGLAVYIALVFRRHAVSYIICGWALLNSYSRLYIGVHYPGDLLTGAIIGSAIAVGCYALVRHFARGGAADAEERFSKPLFTVRIPSKTGGAVCDVTAQRLFEATVAATVLFIAAFAI